MVPPQPGSGARSFRDAVSERDRGCVLSNRMALYEWISFEATHIFPLAYEGYWNDLGHSDWITLPPATESGGSINSPQNGILLGLDEHMLFISFAVSVNLDLWVFSMLKSS